MRRRAALAGVTALALAAAACHSVGYAQDAGADDAGGDAGPCVCEAPSATGTVVIACAVAGCVDGVETLCTSAALLVPLGGACGDAGADAGGEGGEGGACIPQCNSHSCGSADQCGGVCACPRGVPCNPDQTCGNGCDLTGQQTCTPGSTSAASCCSDGYQCKASDAGSAGLCCVVSGSNGTCAQSTDCCDYPLAQCDTFSSTCS
jgi:hypothetical protein